jgi:hypothetical protein
MKIITKLVDLIDEELNDAKRYVKLAHHEMSEHPHLANRFVDLAEAEMGHVKALHEEAARIIEEYRASVGDPPPEMLAVYNYMHDKQIDRAQKIKQIIQDFRS